MPASTPLRSSALAAIGLLLAACAASPSGPPARSAEGEVGLRFLVPQDAGPRHALGEDDVFAMPQLADGAPMPVYPAHVLESAAPETVVCVELHVDAQGHVMRRRPLFGVPGCADSARGVEAFVDASLAAVADWQLTPAGRCHIDLGDRLDFDCRPAHRHWQPVPVRVGYAFVFTRHARQVGMQRLAGQ